MALNLIRNSRVFFTTNVNATSGIVANSGFTTTNTFEIQVQDGFSFTQNTTQDTITLNEAGATPVRGQRSFNTSLEPVDWSFSTYIRPKLEEGTTNTPGVADATDYVYCEEAVLWNALTSAGTISGTGAAGTNSPGWVPTVGLAAVSTISFANSNISQLQKFGLIIVFEAATYVIDSCSVESASIDFGIDAIASIAWAGKGLTLRSVGTVTVTTAGVISGGTLSGNAKPRDYNAKYIANKLSTMTLSRTTFNGQGAKSYTLALTGGNLTIANNLTFLTPANLGTVNQAVASFTGTRAITSSVTAYLKTGTNETSTLLADLLASSTSDDENQFACSISLGGDSSPKVVLDMPTAMIGIPTIASEQIVSTTINIMPQSGSTSAYDITQANELTVKYYSAN